MRPVVFQDLLEHCYEDEGWASAELSTCWYASNMSDIYAWSWIHCRAKHYGRVWQLRTWTRQRQHTLPSTRCARDLESVAAVRSLFSDRSLCVALLFLGLGLLFGLFSLLFSWTNATRSYESSYVTQGLVIIGIFSCSVPPSILPLIKPSIPKSDQFQISPASSREILHHTVLRTCHSLLR